MIKKVRNYIQVQHMIEKGDRIVVGVSGGADSVALLLVLEELKKEYELELFVVHINHGIRADAAADAEYVESLCNTLEIPFYLFEENIPVLAKMQGVTEEEMGRLYRYQQFDKVMKMVGGDKIAVAHHMDDQAETMLFHLIRGSRLAGMEGMRPVNSNVIRPLLKCRKEELLDWLQQRNASWKEDCTNKDNNYSRNSLRNQVMPVLEQINTQAVSHMAEFAEVMSAYQFFFQKQVFQYMQEEVQWLNDKGNNICEVKREHLKQQEMILAKAVIYEMLCKMCGQKKDIGSVHVQAVYDLLSNQSGKKIALPYEMEAVISYEILQIRKSLEGESSDEEFVLVFHPMELLANQQYEWSTQLSSGIQIIAQLYLKKQCTEYEWRRMVEEAGNSKNNYTKFFECDTIRDMLCVRNATKDDYFVINDAGSTKKLSRYFIDRKIPASQRTRIPVVAIAHKVLWIVGERRCEEYKVTEQSEIVLKLTYKGE